MLGIIIVNYKNEGKTISFIKEELIKINVKMFAKGNSGLCCICMIVSLLSFSNLFHRSNFLSKKEVKIENKS